MSEYRNSTKQSYFVVFNFDFICFRPYFCIFVNKVRVPFQNVYELVHLLRL